MYVQDVQTKLWLNMNAVPLPAPHIFLWMSETKSLQVEEGKPECRRCSFSALVHHYLRLLYESVLLTNVRRRLKGIRPSRWIFFGYMYINHACAEYDGSIGVNTWTGTGSNTTDTFRNVTNFLWILTFFAFFASLHTVTTYSERVQERVS
jgi:hypothetical protein